MHNAFSDCLFIECNFNFINFHDNKFTKTSFEMNSFQDVSFEKNLFSTLKMEKNKFEYSLFEECQFSQCLISQNLFLNIWIQNADSNETEFVENDLTEVSIEKSNFKQTLFQKISWNKVLLKKCSFENLNYNLNSFKRVRLRKNTGIPEEIQELVIKGKGSLKPFVNRCFENIYFRIFSLFFLFSGILISLYISYSPDCFVSRLLLKELIWDYDYNYFVKHKDNLSIALDLIIRPFNAEEEAIFKEIFLQRQDPRYKKFYFYFNSPSWIPDRTKTAKEELNQYVKNEYLNFVPLWSSLLEKESSVRRGFKFYTWLINQTLNHEMSSSVYMNVLKKILHYIPSKNREEIHRSLIFITLQKQYFEILYDITESYIFLYNPGLEFFENLIIELSKYKSGETEKIKYFLLSLLKRDPNNDKQYLIETIKNTW